MKELVTFQVGGFANYIGSYFWNFQDELLGLAGDPHADPHLRNSFLDMDVLYCTGETPQGILTYTPRLVSIDYQGSLGSLRSSGSLYNKLLSSDPSHVVPWTGDISRHISEPQQKNKILFCKSLDEEEHEHLEMQTTSANKTELGGSQDKDRGLVDCLEKDVKYWTDFSKVHFHPRSLYESNCSWMDIQDFDKYGSGMEALSGSLQTEEMDKRLQFFVEDCDHIQVKRPSSYTDNAKPFHSSAIYAAALHSITLPFRMVTVGSMASTNVCGAVDIGELTSMLANQSRQINDAVLNVAMPAPPLTGAQGSIYGNLHTSTPEITENVEDLYTIESTTIHGTLVSGGNQASISEVKESVDNHYRFSESKPIFSHLSMARCPLPIPLHFPKIFGRHVGTHGEFGGDPVPESQPRGSLDVHSVPMAARLGSSNAILPFVQKRLTDIRRLGSGRGAPGSEIVKRWGFQKDNVLGMAETLSRMARAWILILKFLRIQIKL